jgi:opacity protein-like surface antigen
MMRIYKYQVSIHAGYSKPVSTMSKYFDPGFLLYADLAYHVSPRVSIIGLFGINMFEKNSASSDTKDKIVLNINLDAQYRRTVSGVLSTYVRVGPGYYFTPGGWSKSGFNTGAGIIYHLNNHLGLNLGVDYHLITKGLSFNNVPTPDLNKNMQFLQVALGINYSF